MHLTEFRVQNYKIINDTGWIPVGMLSIFVGKNESGKSAIFRALSKLNPSDGAGYDGLKEFPRQRYAAEITKTDWPVASGRFSLTQEEKGELESLSVLCHDVELVEVTRHYTGKYSITYSPDIGVDLVTAQDLQYALDVATEQIRNLTAPEGHGDTLGRIKESLLTYIGEQKNHMHEVSQVQKQQIGELINAIKSRANEPWQQDLLTPITEPFYRIVRQIEVYESLIAANRFVIAHLPKFIYFDQYNVIESAIHIPTFIATLKSHPDSPGLRATHCLFRNVNLDLDQLDQLGSHKVATDDNPVIRRQVDERAILLSTASNQMTKKFENWWEQRRIRFRYDIDGDYFRVWVSDDLDPSEIELEQRSAGLQYFFSFFLIFLVEAGDAYQDAILLLDEPGLQLHATAQAQTVRFFEKIAEQNQVFYSTHSPFMLDLDHMDRIKAVYANPDGNTMVSGTEWPPDKDSLFPLQAALAFRIAEHTYLPKKQLIVDDIVDLWLIQAMNYALQKQGKGGLDPEITITPAGGAANLIPLATCMKSRKGTCISLLSGKNAPDKVTESFLAEKSDDGFLLYNQYAPLPDATVEDLFGQEFYLKCAKDVYPQLAISSVTTHTPADGPQKAVLTGVGDAIERRQGENFERWRVAEYISDRICEAPGTLDEETVRRFTLLFAEINRRCRES